MANILTTRRRLLQGAGLGAAVLAAPAIVRAGPAPMNFAFFVSTSPFMICPTSEMVVEMESEVFAHEEARSRASVKRRCYMTFGQKM